MLIFWDSCKDKKEILLDILRYRLNSFEEFLKSREPQNGGKKKKTKKTRTFQKRAKKRTKKKY